MRTVCEVGATDDVSGRESNPSSRYLLQFLKNPVERDGIGGDCCRIRSRGKFRKRSRRSSLLKKFHLVRIHRRARIKNVIVAGQSVHPARALYRRLVRRNQGNLREIQRVSAGGVIPRRRNRAAYVDALSVVSCVHH